MNRSLIYISLLILSTSCNKQLDWLDKKVNKSDVVPSKLENFQAILDNTNIMNTQYPMLTALGADNFYVLYNDWQSTNTSTDRNAYLWQKDIFQGETTSDWDFSYRRIAYANTVLDGIERVKYDNQNEFNNIKGQALFFRAFNYYNLLQVFSNEYAVNTADSDLGLPLKLNPSIDIIKIRESVQETYDQIISDLKLAESLLPETPLVKTRPSKVAAYTLLAKTYLHVGNYSLALDYASSALAKASNLIDFNNLDSTAFFRLPGLKVNPEIIFYAEQTASRLTGVNRQLVDSDLFNSYGVDDLRKLMFFNTNSRGRIFSGYYTGQLATHFAGLATNELYFIRAECYARESNLISALQDLNTILKKRWRSGKYVDFNTTQPETVISTILEEKNKELPFTGAVRWEDLRRLNKEQRFARTLNRTLNGVAYTLPPNDSRYIYPIPDNELKASGIPQNPR